MGADADIDWARTAASALDWWSEAGFDTAIDEAPRDWLAVPPVAVAPTRTDETRTDGAAATQAADAPPMPAERDAFLSWRVGPTAPDRAWGDRVVAPGGAVDAALMILLDMPERDDGAASLLGGEAGRLLDRMLAAIGHDRGNVHLASLTTVRPAAGRLSPEQVALLTPIALRHVASIGPRRLLLLGDAASRAILGASAVPARRTLHVVNHEQGQTQALASFHPRFLLEQPARKGQAWRDLQQLIGG